MKTPAYQLRQSIALGGVIFAPMLMVLAFICPFVPGLVLFGAAALLIILTIILCLINMHEDDKRIQC